MMLKYQVLYDLTPQILDFPLMLLVSSFQERSPGPGKLPSYNSMLTTQAATQHIQEQDMMLEPFQSKPLTKSMQLASIYNPQS